MYLKLIILFVLLGALTASPFLQWSKYKKDFNKVYKSPAEEMERLQIFRENVQQMLDFQRQNPNASFKVGINHLTDRRTEELVSNSKYSIEFTHGNTKRSISTIDFPDSFDWRSKGVITPVEDQGALGQASAFTAVEVIETLNTIKTGQLVRGSVARVIDCCPQPVDPFQCIKKLGGLCAESAYPTPLGQCKPDQCKPVISFDKAVRLQGQNENEMVAWIQNSTLYVAIDASRPSFQMYIGGLYNEQSCSKTMVDHTMQLVGYGKTESGDLYWICKNTWGATWGEQGYMRVLRGQNVCGIASYVIQVS